MLRTAERLKSWKSIIRAIRLRQIRSLPPPREADIVVTLVHGTWARRATWTLPSSALCQTLLVALGGNGTVAIQRFVWSGRNSISARHRAVEALVNHIQSSIVQYPSARHY